MGGLSRAILVIALALVPAAPAAADSLVFERNGNVWVAKPDGSAQRQITSGGGYEHPTQANDGTIVAARQTEEGGRHPRRLHRMDRTGRLLNPPTEAVPVDNSFYIGPLVPEISPSGEFVVYHYVYVGGGGIDAEPEAAFAYANRDTSVGSLGSIGGHLTPSWYDNRYAVLFSAGSSIPHVILDQVGEDQTGGDWFSDPDVPGILADGEVSPTGDRFVAEGDRQLRIYAMNGPPPNPPTLKCVIENPVGEFADPTFAPDGRGLAWAEDNGIWTGTLSNLETCSGEFRLTIPNAAAPDWGPADAGTSGGGGGGSVRCGGQKATIVGNGRANVINGTGRRDVIAGLGGNDTIRGRGGKDLLCGGAGADRLIGGGAADRLLGQGGRDVCIGSAGNDSAATCEQRRSL